MFIFLVCVTSVFLTKVRFFVIKEVPINVSKIRQYIIYDKVKAEYLF